MADRGTAPSADREGDERARADRRVRALETPLDVRWVEDPRFVRLEVRNPVRGTRYDVVLPTYPARDGGFCTCTDFARRGIGTCKHLESGWLWVEEHRSEIAPPAPSGSYADLWTEIDRRLSTEMPGARPDPVRYRWAGAALFE